jgi:PEP-CTERM motif
VLGVGGFKVKFVNTAAALAALAIGVAAAGASQATIYTLTLNGCSSSCGAGPFGAVTVTDDVTDVGSLDVLVQLAAGIQFNGAGHSGTHNSVAFDLVGNPAVTIKNISNANFVNSGAIANDSPFGAFGYSLDWNGPNGNPTGVTSLSFEIFTSGGPLTLGSTLYQGTPLVFAADVLGNGNTGNVAAPGTPGGGVPEPPTWAMMLVGFGGLGAMLRRRRAQAVVAA